MNRNWFTFASFALLITGTFLFFLLSDKSLSEQIKLSAHEVETYKDTFVVINDQKILVEVAETPEKKATGLSNRESLPENTGMLFVFDRPEVSSFWMRQMKFPIDIIWIKNKKIIGFEKNVPFPDPETKEQDLPRYPSPSEIDAVLEINAGHSDKFLIGDKIEIETINSI